jgi:hypothetical protein
MKNKVRVLNFYGFDDDNTMYDVNPYVISEAKEIKNMKYVKVKEEETEDQNNEEENNNENITTENDG